MKHGFLVTALFLSLTTLASAQTNFADLEKEVEAARLKDKIPGLSLGVIQDTESKRADPGRCTSEADRKARGEVPVPERPLHSSRRAHGDGVCAALRETHRDPDSPAARHDP